MLDKIKSLFYKKVAYKPDMFTPKLIREGKQIPIEIARVEVYLGEASKFIKYHDRVYEIIERGMC